MRYYVESPHQFASEGIVGSGVSWRPFGAKLLGRHARDKEIFVNSWGRSHAVRRTGLRKPVTNIDITMFISKSLYLHARRGIQRLDTILYRLDCRRVMVRVAGPIRDRTNIAP